MKTRQLLATIANTFEIGNGCGTFTASRTVNFFEREPFTGALVRQGKVEVGREYLYMWEDGEGENPLKIEADVVLLDNFDQLIYMWAIS